MRQIADANGNVTLAESYEPYGSVLTSTGTASSIFGYAGEQIDSYIKLLFLRARYYSPEMARFLSKDVWQGDYTRPLSLDGWVYGLGNPVNATDPSGLWYCRPSPTTPSCETWVEAALHTLAYAGPNSNSIWSGFMLYDLWPLHLGVYFDSGGNDYELGLAIHLRNEYVNDTIPSPQFNTHITLFAHEIVHITQARTFYSTQDEVDTYVRQKYVGKELGLGSTNYQDQLEAVAWEWQGSVGHVTNNFEKLCQARKILTTDPALKAAWPTYNQELLSYLNGFPVFPEPWCNQCYTP